MVIIQQILNGLTMGSVYALLGVGVTVVYKSLGLMNVAHGDMMMIGAFITLLIIDLGVPLWLAIILGIFCAGMLGLAMERFIYRKVNYGIMLNLMIATIGMQIVLRNAALVLWGVEPKAFPDMFSKGVIHMGPYVVAVRSVCIIILALCLVLLLQLFYKKTRIGKEMTVAAANSTVASMLGINVNRTRFITFGIGSSFAALTGILIAPVYFVSQNMGAVVGVKALAAAVIGGFGNITGAFYGGIILGIVEALGGGLISSAYKDIISFAVMILVLYFKPYGLFAKHVDQKF